ncbi:arylsulfatase [alpha proteobacterium AAP81b]|nr:arylsulfatase [alpha proteobacterium AAP81b]
MAGLLLTTATPALAARPNIVVLLADDWGFSDVGAYGSEIATPNIDALARAGTRFSNFHVAASCAPTRAMLQTGVSHHRAGLGNMPETIPPAHQGKPGYDAVINDRVVTIAQMLQAAGYRTAFSGKWHLGKTRDKLPRARGYDHAFALSQSGADNFEDKPNLLLYDHADWSEDDRPAKLPKDFYSSRFIIDKAVQYIDTGDPRRPFFASINFLANHIPVQAPDADIAAYRGRYDTGWTALRAARRARTIAAGVMPADVGLVTMDSTTDWATLSPAEQKQRSRAFEAYAGMATAMDREVGRLVAHLKASGQYDNTIFVFLSDNGPEGIDPMAGINGIFARAYYNQRPDQQGRPGSLTAIGTSFASAAASPLRGYKFTASEGGLRVPLIIAWPGNRAWRAGAVQPAFAQVMDVTPTLLAAAGVAAPGETWQGRAVEPIQGHSLVPLLTGAATSVHPADEPLGYELAGNAVLFKGDYKLVRNLKPYGDSVWRLYDIRRDPAETRDLSAAMPDRARAMAADYAAYARAEQVLDMPPGYEAPKQVADNAMRDLLVPRLKRSLVAMAPWLIGVLGLVVGGIVAWRRRR